MSDLLNKKCVPCEGGIIPFDISEIHKYQKNLDLKLHEIKYEDVINNFEPTIKNLLKFLEVEWTDNLSEFYKTAENKRIISTPSYDQVNKPLYNKSIGRWKNYEDKFIETNKIFEKWNKEFKY